MSAPEVHGTRELTAVERDFIERHGDKFVDDYQRERLGVWPTGEALTGELLDQDGVRVDIVEERAGFTVVDRRRSS